MKFIEKYYIKEEEYSFEDAKKELEEYSFDGIIEFTSSPDFYFDVKNKIVVEGEGDKIFLDKKYTEIDKLISKDAGQIKLSKNYSLQHFFDDNKTASCIIFYPTPSGNIFHEGYIIRTCVIQ